MFERAQAVKENPCAHALAALRECLGGLNTKWVTVFVRNHGVPLLYRLLREHLAVQVMDSDMVESVQEILSCLRMLADKQVGAYESQYICRDKPIPKGRLAVATESHAEFYHCTR